MTIADDLNKALHDGSPFDGFEADDVSYDLQGWLSAERVFDELIDGLKPQLIVEVGSWKGSSAVYMAKRLAKHRDDFAIVCVDTWLGSAEHWANRGWYKMLNCRNGYPDLYRQFARNVIHEGVQDHIVPIPLPSFQAALLLNQINMRCPMVYIDGGHDFDSVIRDMDAYWPMVTENGFLFGDDYDPVWKGVISAVDDFKARRGDEITNHQIIENKWLFRK